MNEIVSNETLTTGLTLLGVSCVVTLILIGLVAYWLVRSFKNLVAPDAAKLRLDYEKLKVRNPSLSQEAVLKRMIQRESLKAGLIGAITSLGGFFTLPIALPIDILLSTQVQKTMVDFITVAYGKTQTSEAEARLRAYLVMTGGVKATETTSKLLMRGAGRLLGKSFSKLIPFAGALIGFGVNYAIARATGNIALQWYSGKLPRRLASRPAKPTLPSGRA